VNKRTWSLLVALFVPALVLSYPGIGGGKGLFRVQNALVEQEAGLTLSLHALARNAEFDATNSGWVGDLVAPELSYAPVVTKYVGLELFGSWGGVFQTPKSATEDGFIWGYHDLKAGGKVSVPVLPVLKLGGTASYTIADREKKRDWVALDPDGIVQADKLAWSGLATLHLQDVLPSAPNFLLSYGEVAGETHYGSGVELQGKGFALFAEFLSQQVDATTTGIFDTENGHLHLTPGIAFGSATSMMFKLGYTFSFGEAGGVAQPNEIIAGFGFATPFGKRAPAQFGTIAGRVTDARTGAGVAASVAFPENAKLLAQQTDPGTGVFRVERVPAGVVVVEVGADGYQRQAVPIEVRDGAVAQYDFKLRPLVTYGVIAGTVVDATNNRPLVANIEFPGTSVPSQTSDEATGAFRVDDVPVGVYSVTVRVPGYFPATLTVRVEEGQVAAPAFSLTPEAMKSTITGRVSDKKDNSPLAATVSFPNTSVPEAATDPTTGVYSAEIPVGSYAVTVSAEGYITQSAAVVLQQDKPMVKDFALVKEGMAITLRGIYFDVNKTTIKPESRPALEDASKILKENPTIRVEIQGHTDSQGSDEHNLKLSDGRAWSVVNYLVQNFGIDQSRLTAKGYGESRPVADNGTAAGRALNRRVEFVILGQQ